MSYGISISVSGHDSEPHNDLVKDKSEAAIRLLKTLPGVTSATLSGHSGDNTGSITLTTPTDEGVSAPT